jgi:hypothetical protein
VKAATVNLVGIEELDNATDGTGVGCGWRRGELASGRRV